MYDTAERVRRVKLRAKRLRRERENLLIGVLSAASAVLIFLMGAAYTMAGLGHGGTVTGFYGTMLLREGAGGYVLAGVLSFVAGVAVTMLCIRCRKKNE